MKFWRKPLHAMFDAFAAAGLYVQSISEPQPDPSAREIYPDGFQDLSTRPAFLFFMVETPAVLTGSEALSGNPGRRFACPFPMCALSGKRFLERQP